MPMKLITLYLPEHYINTLDELVAEHIYPNRAEAIRIAIRDLLREKSMFYAPLHVSEQAKKDITKPPEELVNNQRRHAR
jgi:antitoxin ParD1/3/4